MRTFATLGILMFAACSSAAAPTAPREETPVVAAAPAKITRAEPSLVCMVNNQYMGKAQIPVVVEGKTYFGCCEMCKSRLANDPTSRAATDPVSGASVDKAAAVIGRDPSGAVQYFENAKNLELYAAR
ncbi:MAG TPA: hypothetical protein VJV78_45995 [Polyangiales bacterium]|nr:hypothetical protein [Polyangiales bacterium]